MGLSLDSLSLYLISFQLTQQSLSLILHTPIECSSRSHVSSAVVFISICMLYLYCIHDGRGRCKFGYSRDPLARVRSLQTGNGLALELVHSIPVDPQRVRELERLLHREIGLHRRVKGEWFTIDSHSAKNLLTWFEIRYC
jgi:Meiotically up-regulated gene 113